MSTAHKARWPRRNAVTEDPYQGCRTVGEYLMVVKGELWPAHYPKAPSPNLRREVLELVPHLVVPISLIATIVALCFADDVTWSAVGKGALVVTAIRISAWLLCPPCPAARADW